MMGGCLKNMFAVFGCLTILIVGTVLSWVYQDPIKDVYYAFSGDLPGADGVEISGPARANPDWARSARRKQEAMARFLGPESVTLNAAEAAALVEDGLDPVARDALDSIQVTLEPGRIVVDLQLMTDVWGREQLGILGAAVGEREPIRVGGLVEVVRPGILSWTPDELRWRNVPIPTPMVKMWFNGFTGRTDGALWLAAPVTIRDMEIGRDQVTFYRRVR